MEESDGASSTRITTGRDTRMTSHNYQPKGLRPTRWRRSRTDGTDGEIQSEAPAPARTRRAETTGLTDRTDQRRSAKRRPPRHKTPTTQDHLGCPIVDGSCREYLVLLTCHNRPTHVRGAPASRSCPMICCRIGALASVEDLRQWNPRISQTTRVSRSQAKTSAETR